MEQPTLTAEPTGTLVLLTNPEREKMREKAAALAPRLGIRKMSLSAYIRWAALNANVHQVSIDTAQATQAQEVA